MGSTGRKCLALAAVATGQIQVCTTLDGLCKMPSELGMLPDAFGLLGGLMAMLLLLLLMLLLLPVMMMTMM